MAATQNDTSQKKSQVSPKENGPTAQLSPTTPRKEPASSESLSLTGL